MFCLFHRHRCNESQLGQQRNAARHHCWSTSDDKIQASVGTAVAEEKRYRYRFQEAERHQLSNPTERIPWPNGNAKMQNRKTDKKKIYYVQEKNLKALPANFAKSHTGEQNVLINSRDLISKLAMLTAGPQEATAVVQS